MLKSLSCPSLHPATLKMHQLTPKSSAHLGFIPYHTAKYHPSTCFPGRNIMEMDRQTDRLTHTQTNWTNHSIAAHFVEATIKRLVNTCTNQFKFIKMLVLSYLYSRHLKTPQIFLKHFIKVAQIPLDTINILDFCIEKIT